ncbi:Glycosyl-4,4'-diaponeurosporenoate acyltransferase [Fimbriimonadaceae bacterium]|jgi:hypothetical protein
MDQLIQCTAKEYGASPDEKALPKFSKAHPLFFVARLMELIGVRVFYTFLAPPWHQLPKASGLAKGAIMSGPAYRKGVRDCRYYASANAIRLASYIPIYFGIKENPHPLSVTVLALLVAFHVLSILAEAYKGVLLWIAILHDRVTEDEAQSQIPGPQRPKATGLFAPYWFETQAGYMRIGLEHFRKRVATFVDSLSGGPATERSSRKGLYNFVNDTIAAEKIHLIASAMGGCMMVPFIAERKFLLVGYISLLVLMDLYLALLQRFHRTRVWKALRLDKSP